MTTISDLNGRVLGERYRLLSFIGCGGFSSVYEAEDLESPGARVAVKVMKPEFAKRVAIEARIAEKFKHPHAVEVYGFDAQGEFPYLVLELLTGETLDRLRPLTSALLRKFVTEVADVLQHGHEQGLIHRDLKPTNIMLVQRGTPAEKFKILDFGIATQLNAELTLRNATMDGAGSIEYMPPELLSDGVQRPPTKQVDIYAFGVILYELLTGVRPFAATSNSIMSLLTHIQKDAPPRFREVAPHANIDTAVESLVLQCLSKDPHSRPSSMQEVAERFLEADASESDAPANSQTRNPPSAVPDEPAVELTQVPQKERRQAVQNPPALRPTPLEPSANATENVDPYATNLQVRPAYDHPPGSRSSGQSSFGSIPPRPQPVPTNPSTPEPYATRAYEVPRSTPAQSAPDGRYVTNVGTASRPQRPPVPTTGFAWGRNLFLAMLAVSCLIAGVFVFIQRHSALQRNSDWRKTGQFDLAVTDLSQGTLWTHPLVNREQLLTETATDWIAEAQRLTEASELPSAITTSRQIHDHFPDRAELGEVMASIATQIQGQIQSAADRDDFERAFKVLDDRTTTLAFAELDSQQQYFNRADELAEVRQKGGVRLKDLLEAGTYDKVIDLGQKLQRGFPKDPEIREFVAQARILHLVQQGDEQIAAGNLEAGAEKYDEALNFQPSPTAKLRHEILWKRVKAYHATASQRLPQEAGAGFDEVQAAAVLRLLDSEGEDLARLQKEIATEHEVSTWKAKRSLLRGQVHLRRQKPDLAVCDLKLALRSEAERPEAASLLQQICQNAGNEGLEHYQAANKLAAEFQRQLESTTDPAAFRRSPAGSEALQAADREWQTTNRHLSLALLAAESAIQFQSLDLDAQILSLYSFRAEARSRLIRPDVNGALRDLRKFLELAAELKLSDADFTHKHIWALATQAWILATCRDERIRDAKLALTTAKQASELFERANGRGGLSKEDYFATQTFVLKVLTAAQAANGEFAEARRLITEEAFVNFAEDSPERALFSELLENYYSQDLPYIDAAEPQDAAPLFQECAAAE